MTKTIQSIFGSESSAGTLSFLSAYGQGYASEIARFIGMDLFAVQKQLEKFQAGGLLTSRTQGRTRIYSFNTKYPLYAELKSLVDKSAALQTQEERSGKVNPLPKSLEPFFWDHPFEKLSWEADRELVIRRLLSDGSWDAVTWLRGQMGNDALRKWLIVHRGRGLSKRQLGFWSLALGLPGRQVRSWAVNEAWVR
jgi:hypothetical protein